MLLISWGPSHSICLLATFLCFPVAAVCPNSILIYLPGLTNSSTLPLPLCPLPPIFLPFAKPQIAARTQLAVKVSFGGFTVVLVALSQSQTQTHTCTLSHTHLHPLPFLFYTFCASISVLIGFVFGIRGNPKPHRANGIERNIECATPQRPHECTQSHTHSYTHSCTYCLSLCHTQPHTSLTQSASGESVIRMKRFNKQKYFGSHAILTGIQN